MDPPCLVPVFVSAALILRNSQRIFRETERSCDIASMHHALSTLPHDLESLEILLSESSDLINKYKQEYPKLIKRGVQIMDYQNKLWDTDDDHVRRRRRPNPGWLRITSNFVFVRHRWATMSIVIFGAAYLIQSRYYPETNYDKAFNTIKAAFKAILPKWVTESPVFEDEIEFGIIKEI